MKAAKLSKKDIKSLDKRLTENLERLGCGKAAGGRILMNAGGATLTKCANKGAKRLEQIILRGGAKEGEQELAKKILQAGRGLRGMFSLSGMFGPAATAFLVGTEAGLVGYDMISQGKTFREAVGDSVFNYALGDRTKIDPKEERYKGYAAAGVDKDTIGKISAFENAMDEVKNMQQEFEKEDVAYRDAVISGPRMSGAIKQKQIKNYYDQVKKNQELIKYLEQPQTQEKLKIVDDDLLQNSVVYRPPSLVVGVGLHWDTTKETIKDGLMRCMNEFKLSEKSITKLVSIKKEKDVVGLAELAKEISKPIEYFEKEELASISTPNPSKTVQTFEGTASVSEAAAIKASGGELVVEKQKFPPNLTIAIARIQN